MIIADNSPAKIKPRRGDIRRIKLIVMATGFQEAISHYDVTI